MAGFALEIQARQSRRTSALYSVVGNVCSGLVAHGAQTDADIGLFVGFVFCWKAFWVESCSLSVGPLVFQSVRLAVAVCPGRLDSPWRCSSHSIDHSNKDCVLSRHHVHHLCFRGDDGNSRTRPWQSSSPLDFGAVRSQRQDQSRALPSRASRCYRRCNHAVPAGGFSNSAMAVTRAVYQVRSEFA